MVSVPSQALMFLGVVAGLLVLLVVFFMYINKKACFSNIGGFPCIEQPPTKSKSNSSKLGSKEPLNGKGGKNYGELGSAYAYDEAETSSDSDEDVMRHYQEQMQRVPSNRSLRSNRSHASRSSKRGISAAERGEAATPEKNEGEGVEKQPITSTPAHRHPDDRLSLGSSLRKSDDSSRDPANFEGNVEQYNQGFQHEEASPEHHSATSSEHGYGDEASMSVGEVGDEHLFDVSDLQDREPALISKCGTLEVIFSYSAIRAKMHVKIGVARDIPTKDRGGASNVQVRLLLLPTKKTRHKTKIKPGEAPEFNESFDFKVPPEEVNNMGIRVRLYGTERMRRERMIGEAVVGFAAVNQDTETTHWLTLEPRSNLSGGDSKLDLSSLSRSDSASSTQSIQHGGMPELLIGLAYNGTTGRLSVEVIKGSNFRNMAMNRAPDTYVKLTLMSPNGQEIARSKTSIRRGQPNPLYKETFMFQVALFQLPDVTLMVSVYNKRSMKRKDMIGWFSLGLNNSGEEELGHWNDMRESKGEQVCRWHVLLES